MTIQEINNIVLHNETRKYRVKLSDGTTRIVRLWRDLSGLVCIIAKGRRHYGHTLSPYSWDDIEKWETLKEIKKEDIDYKRRILKRAKDAQKMLEESGLWPNIKKEIDDFLALSDSEVSEFVKAATSDFYENVYSHLYKGDNKFPWLHTYQVFESFLSNKCWKSIAYGEWSRKRENEKVREAIANKKDYRNAWVNGYDNSLELCFRDDIPRGWYSEEFRNCGNGHYYLLFDATHAIFYEND